jgi:hypothetical protein
LPQQIKFSKKPGITGAFMSLLLVVSFFLPRIWEGNSTVGSLNTVLIVVIICLAAKLIKQTSELYGDLLWNHRIFPVLMSVPVFNLLITAVQFVVPNASFMLHPVFITLLIISSLPAFCCYYFTAMWLHFKRDRRLVITSLIVDVVGLMYILIRLFDRVIIPLLPLQGNEIFSLVDKLVSLSPWFSLLIYLLSFANFIICAKVFSETDIISE